MKFSDEDGFVRVSDFYRSKGVLQEKKVKFQVLFLAEGATKAAKISTTQLDVAQYLGPGIARDRVALNG